MGAKHSINLAKTKVGCAAMEILEDRLDDVLRHYQDANASGKASKIKLELTVTPDEARERFEFTVSGTTAMSPRKTFATQLYAGPNSADEMEVVEFNPRQLRMFDKPAVPAGIDPNTGELLDEHA